MNMPTTPNDDELASAFLDGEATAEEVARLNADPLLIARVEELRAARDTLRAAVDPIDPTVRDTAIAAALAAAPTDELAVVRARRVSSARWLKVASAAAAIVLLVAAVPLLARLGDDSDEDFAQVGSSIAADTFTAQEDATADGGDAAGAPAAGYIERAALGEHASIEELAAALRAERAAERDAAESTTAAQGGAAPSDAPRCAAEAQVDEPIAALEQSGAASIGGEPVSFAVFLLADGRAYLVVQDAACAVLFSGEL